jgi:FMN phosphatase YigB (HAD superfamily)
LCQQAGLSYSTLTKIERGAIKSPSIFTIQRIADALDIGLDELLGAAPHKPTKQRSKSGISFIYFDINGCLVHFFQRAFTRIAEDTGTPAETVESAFWHYNDQVCRGDISMSEFNRAFGHTVQAPSLDWQPYYLEVVKPVPHMAELVTWAAGHYRIGLLSNIMPGLIDALLKQGTLPRVNYDAIVDSSAVKAIKPEVTIYKIAAEKANCPATEVLLIDDSRANLMAAEKCGWHVLWFDDYRPEEAIARIKSALEFAP